MRVVAYNFMGNSIGKFLFFLSRYRLWPRPKVSTGIHGGLTYGYGKLDNNGYWQFPVRIKEKEGTVICLSTDKFCPDCEGTGYTEHDAGGGNSYKLACEYCGGKGEIEKET